MAEERRHEIFAWAEMGFAVVDVKRVDPLLVQKQTLVDLVVWYRDSYHKTDGKTHDELIQKIVDAADAKELEMYEQIVDGWLDY